MRRHVSLYGVLISPRRRAWLAQRAHPLRFSLPMASGSVSSQLANLRKRVLMGASQFRSVRRLLDGVALGAKMGTLSRRSTPKPACLEFRPREESLLSSQD